MKCKGKKGCPQGDKKFTSVYYVEAFPDQVVNVTVPTGGLPVSVQKAMSTSRLVTNLSLGLLLLLGYGFQQR